MIRPLMLADVFRLLGVKGQEWATTPQTLFSQSYRFSVRGFLLGRPWLRRRGGSWIAVKGRRVQGVVSARPTAGPSSWLVDHLVTLEGDGAYCGELLDAVALKASRCGAERLFLHPPDNWHLGEIVRHSGFSLCTTVLAFTLPGRRALLGMEPPPGFRPRLPADDHSLFRLYNAATPAGIRSAMGVTLQQWKDAQEPSGRRTREVVVEHQGAVKAWGRLDRASRWVRVRTVLHPDWSGDQAQVVALVLQEAGPRPVLWDVPAYQPELRTILERTGFELVGSYHVMVRPLAALLRRPSLAPAKVV
ncbi:MAG: hypothetical protein HY535_08825 [Chloroflexi bacterium]|nr:hypothetical protein [Chloroflexota bacterium]